MRNQSLALDVKKEFRSVCLTRTQKPPAPYSLRLSEEEKTYLQERAGARPLSVYIREKLLGDRAEKRRELRKPRIDDQKLSALLAGLGHSRIPNNLNQLAKAANCGSLDMSSDSERQLQEACAAVIAMREALFIALGLRVGSDE